MRRYVNRQPPPRPGPREAPARSGRGLAHEAYLAKARLDEPDRTLTLRN
jgi:hypothetical protein